MRKSGLPVPAAALLSGFLAASAAAHEPARDSFSLPGEPTPSANSLAQEPSTAPNPAPSARREGYDANPLWRIPISELTATQARPLFSPSRRPPEPPTLAALMSAPAKPPPQAKRGPDHPLLTVLGTIVSDSVEIGVFTDEISHDVVRLKAGEAHDGWTLSAVSGRAAIFQKQGYPAATLVLPAAGAEVNAPSFANRFATPVIPAATKGGVKRPPREG